MTLLTLKEWKDVFPTEAASNEDSDDINGEAYRILIDWMRPKTHIHQPTEEVKSAIGYIQPIENSLIDAYMESVWRHFRKHAAPIISSVLSSTNRVEAIQQIAQVLRDAHSHYFHPFDCLPFSARSFDKVSTSFTVLVELSLSQTPFKTFLKSFFDSYEIDQPDAVCLDVCDKLRTVGLNGIIEKTLAERVTHQIERYISTTYEREWDASVIEQLDSWINDQLIKSLELMLGSTERLNHNLIDLGHDFLAKLRISELFDIIVDVPDSIPSLEDLKVCLRSSHQRAMAVSAFQLACSKRLLHGGANTVDIIAGYISTIRGFVILDPKGVLLDKVSKPIRRYLREREDVIPVIVSGILGEDSSDIKELEQELSKSESKNSGEDLEDDLTDMDWNPDPLDAPPDFKKGKTSDIIGSMLSLYDNKDVFVKEFEVVFANRLLSLADYKVDEVLMNLELLKLRFGERDLINLDVMVKDISESKRMDTAIHRESIGGKQIYEKVHSMVLSRLFWPTFKDEEVNLPSAIQGQLDLYSKGFIKLKQGRKLEFLKSLGTVTVELEFQDRNLEFKVSPASASLINLFHNKASYLISDLAGLLNIDTVAVKRLLVYWVRQGVLKQHPDDSNRYVVQEILQKDDNNQEADAEEELSSAVQTSQERAREEMKIYWSYIVGMLTNLGATPVDRIHSFLKMLVPKENPYTKSLEELQMFLTLMVEEESLELAEGSYKLKR